MTLSQCVKCGNKLFELVEGPVKGSNFKLNFIQCTSCGAVVGVVPYYDPGFQTHQANGKLDELKSRISNIEYSVERIESKLT